MEIPVATRGAALDEVTHNFQEAVQLHLEGGDFAEPGLVANPSIPVTVEPEPAYAWVAPIITNNCHEGTKARRWIMENIIRT